MRHFLTKDASLKWLETPAVYHLKNDELYELDEEAFALLKSCAGEKGCRVDNPDFMAFCLSEGLLTDERPTVKRPPVDRAPLPSLRYLELQITDRCNLRCRHCYIGESSQSQELAVARIHGVLREFELMQGLRVLITGGEPLLHSSFDAVNALLPDFSLRKVLFTNGLLLSENRVEGLNVHEVQISIDGMENAHDLLRGQGTFSKAIAAVRLCLDKGIDVSVSTMVHAMNLGDFDEMDSLFRGLGVKDWTVDIPCSAGRLEENSLFRVMPEEGGRYLKYGFGGGIHSSAAGFGCGLHLMSVSADGRASKCTFYTDRAVGRIEEGLRECWLRIVPVRLSDLACDCAYLDVCRGGCRFRAEQTGGPLGRDLYKCHFYGII
ncbi:MAG: radical SAM protein [Thermodesulfovibrionales bacterium]